MILKMIYRELKSSPKFILIFTLNLTIGLLGLVSIETFKSSFSTELETRSKTILGADLAIHARTRVDEDKIRSIGPLLGESTLTKNIGLFSMAFGSKISRLSNIRIIGNHYPFYGHIKLRSGEYLKTPKGLEAYVYPEILKQLEVEIGETIKIGKVRFKIKGVITDDGQQDFQMGGIAPRIYISKEGLKKADLIQKGSTVTYSYYFKTSKKLPEDIEKRVSRSLNDSSLRVQTPKSASGQISRILNYLNDFLGLVSLSGLFLATMGLMYLYRSFLYKRRKEIAIFQFLGLSKEKIFFILIGQLLVLSIFGSLIAISFGPLILPLLMDFFNEYLGYRLSLRYGIEATLVPFTIGVLSCLLMGIPLVAPYLKQDFKFLFSHDDQISSKTNSLFFYLPWVLFFFLISIYISHSVIIGSILSAFLFLSLGLLFFFGNIILSRLHFLSRVGSLEKKLSWGFITRFKISTLFIFSSLMISTSMITVIPLMRDVLLNEVERPLKKGGPSLFLFDIQPEQVSGLTSLLEKNENEVLIMAPLIRSRLLKINEQAVSTEVSDSMTREQEREVRMRNRGVNLSYRDGLDSSEKLVEGRLPKGVYNYESDKYAEVTLEQRYAKRLHVKIGDTLEFDVLGIKLLTKIVGLRSVQWSSFRPNFFIQFQKGVLDDAPKTFIAAIGESATHDSDFVQGELFKGFPNVSIVDVTRLINKIKGIMGSMVIILRIMTLLVFSVGLMVLYSLVAHQMILRTKDINLLKVLGLNDFALQRIVLRESLYISFFSSLIGASLSLGLGFLMSKFIFETSFVLNLQTLLISVGVVTILSLVVTYLATRKVLRKKPSDVFSEIN